MEQKFFMSINSPFDLYVNQIYAYFLGHIPSSNIDLPVVHDLAQNLN